MTRFVLTLSPTLRKWVLYDLRTCGFVLLAKPLPREKSHLIRSYIAGTRVTAANVLEFCRRIKALSHDVDRFSPLYRGFEMSRHLGDNLLEYQRSLLSGVFQPAHLPHLYQLVFDARGILKASYPQERLWQNPIGGWNFPHTIFFVRTLHLRLAMGSESHPAQYVPDDVQAQVLEQLQAMSGFEWCLEHERTDPLWHCYELHVDLQFPTPDNPEEPLKRL